VVAAPRILSGVSDADDAYLALGGKSLALGPGYGAPQSSEIFVPFDPGLTSGPPLILPLAVMIRLVGPSDFLPGAMSLVVFVGQLAISGLILARRFSWTATSAFLFGTIVLLLSLTWRSPYLGIFIGEPATFGFILMGAALLAVEHSARAVVAGAICLSLALLTKQIALFAAAGVVGAWLVLAAIEHLPPSTIVRRVAIVAAAGAVLPVAFELVKLLSLGPEGYGSLFGATFQAAASQGPARIDLPSRVATSLAVLDQRYAPALVLAVLGAVSIACLVALRRNGIAVTARLALLLWIGGSTHIAYYLFASSLKDRYLWIGIALIGAAIAAPLLALPQRMRTATVAVVVASTILLGWYRPFLNLNQQSTAALRVHDERVALVQLLDEHPDLPFAGHFWQGIFDVVYLKQTPGVWAYEPNLLKLRDREFLAVINTLFTPREGSYVGSVTSTCAPITDGIRFATYRCGPAFWQTYPAPAVPVSDVQPAGLVGRATEQTTTCNLERLDGTRWNGTMGPVQFKNYIIIAGWGADAARGRPARSITVRLRDSSGRAYWAPTVRDDRPDVASFFNDPALTASGFTGVISARGLAAGEHEVSIVMDTGDRILECGLRKLSLPAD
jgi:hypothetical protein